MQKQGGRMVWQRVAKPSSSPYTHFAILAVWAWAKSSGGTFVSVASALLLKSVSWATRSTISSAWDLLARSKGTILAMFLILRVYYQGSTVGPSISYNFVRYLHFLSLKLSLCQFDPLFPVYNNGQDTFNKVYSCNNWTLWYLKMDVRSETLVGPISVYKNKKYLGNYSNKVPVPRRGNGPSDCIPSDTLGTTIGSTGGTAIPLTVYRSRYVKYFTVSSKVDTRDGSLFVSQAHQTPWYKEIGSLLGLER